MSQLIRQARAAGYASRYRGEIPGMASTATGTIALPLRVHEKVCACIAITFFSRVLKVEEAAKRYLPDLKAACDHIERELAGGAGDRAARR